MTQNKDKFKEYESRYVDLAQPVLGAEILKVTDDFFAEVRNLIAPEAPIFIHDKFTARGKWMDGWESRRKRETGHDYCILRICRGIIFAINIDTSYFTGNFPEAASIEACDSEFEPDENTEWEEIVPRTTLQGDHHNWVEVTSRNTWNYLRLHIYPDGGVARLRVYGEVYKNWELVSTDDVTDLAATENGGVALVCSDMHFGHMRNLTAPGFGRNMGDGWETKRRRGPGFDWVIIRLGCPGLVHEVEIDTSHFLGNYPQTCTLRAIYNPLANRDYLINEDCEWVDLLPENSVSADNRHIFNKDQICDVGVVSHVKLEIRPDGGVSRLRVRGTKSEDTAIVLQPEPLTVEEFEPYGDVIEIEERSWRVINHGYADRFDDLVNLDISDDGVPELSIFRSRPISFPFPIEVMERHPMASQAFIPKGNQQFLVVVAEPTPELDVSRIRMFVTNGRQGINYKRGVWHHFVMAVGKEQEFIVISRSRPDDNTDEVTLEQPCPIIKDLVQPQDRRIKIDFGPHE